MAAPVVYFWKKTPFIRLLLPFIAGIIIQENLRLSLTHWWVSLIFSIILISLFFFIPFFQRFKLSWVEGIGGILLFISVGALLTWYNNIRYDKKWFGNFYTDNTTVIVSLDEPLVEKTKSLKANASVNYIIKGDKAIKVKGRIILYFKKDSLTPQINYGSQIIFHKSLQEIKNSGNPGGFDYKRYSLFQGITHQVYLQPGEFDILKEKQTNYINSFLYAVRDKVLAILRTNIKGDKELGLAEALLIGYKDDLDKTLVQSYSNTGVVHIIAISGMHLALIYWLLNLLLTPFSKRKKWRWIKPVIAISLLWSFSLLTGASASVLRAAVMFTFIVLADSFSKKSSIYNTLAASAFCLLCYNPYWLWDVGFQLSYAAVLSIVIFMRPIYNLFYFKNKFLDRIWKLNAVTLAAQVLTTPLSIYHFHQFPVYFFLTNLIAVPLSSAIVLGEILLCVVSFIPPVALLVGKTVSWLITLMNSYVERIESLPGSLWDGLQVNSIQAILLFISITGLGFWLIEKIRKGLFIGLTALLLFYAARSYSFISADQQQKLIVYNVPQRRAIDFIDGRHYLFYGDPGLLADDFVQNFHLKPSRILNRIAPAGSMNGLAIDDNYAVYKNERILFADTAISFSKQAEKKDIDLLIISKNPKLYIAKLASAFNIKQVVFDGSVPFWKLPYWKKDCDSLHIPYYDVNEKGAFVMNLN
jgi:competence protein ComEC